MPVIIPAVRILRDGAEFGTLIHAVTCMQIALSRCNPKENASEEGSVIGYDFPLNLKPPVNRQVRKRRPPLKKCVGLYSTPHLPVKTKHGPQNIGLFGETRTCGELVGVNLSLHEQDRFEGYIKKAGFSENDGLWLLRFHGDSRE